MKKTAFILIIICIIFCIGGCGFVTTDTASLLAPPKTAAIIDQLQGEIDKLLDLGGEFSAPVSGENRQSVQLFDLDGDDEEEAIIFLRTSRELPLKLVIFSKTGGVFVPKAEYEMSGTSFDTVSYMDLTGNGIRELVIGCSLGSGIPKALHVLSFEEDKLTQMLSSTYSGFSVFDIRGINRSELIIARHNAEEQAGALEVYKWEADSGELELAYKTELSQSTDSLKRMRAGYLSDGTPAMFISGILGKTDLVVDICAFRRDELVNILLDEETGMSRHIIRQYTLNGGDINGDGALDIPQLIVVPDYEGKKSGEQFRKVSWIDYDINGEATEVMQTYHNSADGWYFIIPQVWKENVAFDRRDSVSGERTIVFTLVRDGYEPVDLLTIYTLTGDNRADRSTLDDRFLISSPSMIELRPSTLYSAKLNKLPPTGTGRYSITKNTVMESFRLIQTEWTTGELTP